jgi:flagellar biosynthesis GTPase FlhF
LSQKVFEQEKINKEIKLLLNKIFETKDETRLIQLLDELFELNTRFRIPALTGSNANVINDFMFVYNSKENFSVISLADRYKLINFFRLGRPEDFYNKSFGEKIVETRKLVASFKAELGLNVSNRAFSRFLYHQPVLMLWKKESLILEKDLFLQLLQNKKQIILYGPPGTGKTFSTKKFSMELIRND